MKIYNKNMWKVAKAKNQTFEKIWGYDTSAVT
jgi:hypothetical protein